MTEWRRTCDQPIKRFETEPLAKVVHVATGQVNGSGGHLPAPIETPAADDGTNA